MPRKSLADLEAEIWAEMVKAYRDDDHEGAEQLYRMWIKVPSNRPEIPKLVITDCE